MSLTCALWAMMLQQQTRRHLPRYSIPEEARMRAFFGHGSETLYFHLAVALLTFLVQIELALFFAGVILYLLTINFIVAFLACIWAGVSAVGYIYITISPVFNLKSPLNTPFSIPLVLVCRGLPRRGFKSRWFAWNLAHWAEVQVRKQSSMIDGRILKQTLDALALREDNDLELFFAAIPGFCDSNVVGHPTSSLDIPDRERLAKVLVTFWERTMTSGLHSGAIQERRLAICVGAIKAVHLANTVLRILDVSRSPEILGRSLASLYKSDFAPLARGITAGIISNLNGERNHGWSTQTTLTKEELDLSEDMYRAYLAHGDSILLANLIHLIRHFLDFFRDGRASNRDVAQEALCILPLVSQFSIRNTLPKLQQDFCDLWDMIVQHRDDHNSRVDHNSFTKILDNIRPLYNDLPPTDSTTVDSLAPPTNSVHTLRPPALYPLPERPDDHPNLPSEIHEAVGDTTDGPGQTPTTTSPIAPRHMSSLNNVPQAVPRQHVSSSDVPASSCPPLPESQGMTIPPISDTDVTQGIADASIIDLSIDIRGHIPIDSSSPSTNDAPAGPRPDEGTTGMQTEIPSQPDPPTTVFT